MAKVLMTVVLDPAEAALDGVIRKLGLTSDDIDRDFGLVSLRPEDHLYAILVEEAVAARLQGAEGLRGPFSNPRIEPFGPPAGGR